MTKTYVQRVLEAIYSVEADVIRLEVEAAANGATTPPRSTEPLLTAIYDGDQFTNAILDLANDWENGQMVAPFASEPGVAIVSVRELVDSARGCIIATFDLDRSPSIQGRAEPTLLIAALKPKPDDADPGGINPTSWVMTQQGVMNPEVTASCG